MRTRILIGSTQYPTDTGMILAAGFGKRLLPFTQERPKTLIEVLGKPLLHYHIEKMIDVGIKNIVINAHHLSDELVKSIKNFKYGVNIHVLCESEILGTGGGIKNAEKYLRMSKGPILLIQGDVFYDFNFESMVAAHRLNGGLSTLALKTTNSTMGYGTVGTDQSNRILSFSNWVNYSGTPLLQRLFCGVHLLSQDIFRMFPDTPVFCINRDVYPSIIESDKKIFGLEQSGYYCDVGTPQRLWQTNMDLLEGGVRLKNMNPFARFLSKDSIYLGKSVTISPKANIYGPVVLDDECIVNDFATVGPFAVIGKSARVGHAAKVSHSVVLSDSNIDDNERVYFTVCSKKFKEKIK